ncbi:hypothetical protein HMSSN036_67730 [Paenibacillus macerans]|nr:hypothetical protein HMSSN036_67730 [Paenibacillus macerans]
MENHIATLARWLLVPVFLLIVAGLLYFVFSKLGWKKSRRLAWRWFPLGSSAF